METKVEHPGKLKSGGETEEKILINFFSIYKTARIIDENNETYKNKISTFFNTLRILQQDHDEIAVKIISGHYFVNDHLVHFKDKGLSGSEAVLEEWAMLGIGGVVFRNGITREELSKFFKFIANSKPSIDNLDSLALKLKNHELPHVVLLSMKEMEEKSEKLDENTRQQIRRMARANFFRAVSVVEDVYAATAEGREINIATTKRVVHSLIDHIIKDESSMIELTAIKDFDDYTYVHSTNVCVYALTIGVRLGMDRPRLSQLGFAALFHDVGKVKLPADLIRKPDSYDENDWMQMQRHPLLGAKTILRNLKFDIYTARAARGAFEHHINSDFTGYPFLNYKKRQPNLFSRIISVVDTFDALTSGRVYIKKKINPDEVIKKMRYQMHIKFDPFLLKLFTNIVGIYPAGSLVLLATEELAVVLTNNEEDFSKPLVKIVGNKDGLLEKPLWADLSSPEHEHRKIIRLVEPEKYGLNIEEFILQD